MCSFELVCEVFVATIEDMLVLGVGRMGEVAVDTVELVGMLVYVSSGMLAGISRLGISKGALVDRSRVGEREINGVTNEVVVGVTTVWEVALLLAAVVEVELCVM